VLVLDLPDGRRGPDRLVPADTATTVHEVVGRVVSVTPNGQFVVVDHGPIEGFMDAMSMPFAVADPVALDVEAGDFVRFLIPVAPESVGAYGFEHR
jgi:Cu/Ag efflux protein CusF